MAFLPLLFFAILTTFVTYCDALQNNYISVKGTGRYYKHHPQKSSWYEARAKCQSEGGVLFAAENENELTQVLNAFSIKDETIHVGISDLETSKVYLTVDGWPLNQVYYEWSVGEPNSGVRNNLRCVLLFAPSRQYGTYRCEERKPYICKLNQNTQIEEMKIFIENVNNTLTGEIQQQAVAIQSQTASLNTALEQLSNRIANQASATARQMETIQRQEAASHRLMETLEKQSVNQMALLERLAESIEHQSTMLGLLINATRNQTATMERLLDEDNRFYECPQ